ncbi:MAG: hypothetical protein HY716_13015 [Planctomycetes bacterium]|nr:hypothetical protein [Planctomycetota bacterium]
MSDTKGYGEQLFQRLRQRGMSRSQVYKVIALQRLCEDVATMGETGALPEAALLEISRIESPARQKQLAEIAVERELPLPWVRGMAQLIRGAERASSAREANHYWDFFFEVEDALEQEGPTKEMLDRVKGFKPSPPSEGLEGIGDRRLIDFRRFDVKPGRGLDVGTSNIVASVRQNDGASLYNIQRNAFLDVRSDTFTRKMLMKLGVDHIIHGEKGFVIGDPAFELANIFEKNTRRPMKDGMISPTEPEALMIERLVISQTIGKPQEVGEVCAFSVPADPIDTERNVVYHTGSIEAILRGLGYTPKALLEGHAVVFAELGSEEYTGIGISCGAGMFNICIAYKSLPALTFSTSRGGDWIDNNVAHALGLPSSQVCAVKESGVDLNRPRDRIEEAICIYYRNLIHYSLETMRQKFESAHHMPAFSRPVSLVCAGGTSMVKGFIDIFRSEFSSTNFPIEVKEIRLARDPLRTVALGCLEYSLEEMRARAPSGPAAPPARSGKTERVEIVSGPPPAETVPAAPDLKVPDAVKETVPASADRSTPEAPPADEAKDEKTALPPPAAAELPPVPSPLPEEQPPAPPPSRETTSESKAPQEETAMFEDARFALLPQERRPPIPNPLVVETDETDLPELQPLDPPPPPPPKKKKEGPGGRPDLPLFS